MFLAAGAALLLAAWGCRMSPAVWGQIPFKDDWTELFQQAANGVALLKRGVVVGWNWGLLGGYPTSTDIAQNLGTVGFLPMALLGDRLGYHVLHAVMFVAIPLFLWWDLRDEPRDTRLAGTALGCFFAAGYSGPLGIERRHQLARRRLLRHPRAGRQPRRAPRPTVGRTAAAPRPDAGALHACRVRDLRRHLSADRGRLLP